MSGAITHPVNARAPRRPDAVILEGIELADGDILAVSPSYGRRTYVADLALVREGRVVHSWTTDMKPTSPRGPVFVLGGIPYRYDETGNACGHHIRDRSPWGDLWVYEGLYAYRAQRFSRVPDEGQHALRVLLATAGWQRLP